MNYVVGVLSLMVGMLLSSAYAARGEDSEHQPLEILRVSDDGRTFVLADSGRQFVPFGFNYDHDEKGRLIEDYWDTEWAKVEQDFSEMRQLGANVVRIHLQFSKFMETADKPNAASLDRLQRLVKLAESQRLYLDLTGLGCYHKKDVPDWYDKLDEPSRWQAQAKFWSAIAERCADSPAIFFYDLMNEPVVPGQGDKRPDWLGPPFAGKHFVQFITLETKGRPRPQVACEWIHQLVAAIRQHDRRHLVTVGLVDWSLDRPGLSSGFVPEKIATELDFVCVHIYPESKKLDTALDTLKGFSLGKPVIIEEMFPLKCSADELSQFIDRSRAAGTAAGWIGFYWGQTLDDLQREKTIGNAIIGAWLTMFQEKANQLRQP